MTTKLKKWQLPFLVLLIVGTVLIIRQQRNMPYQKNTGNIFGTVYAITYQHDKDLHKDILSALNRVDTALSMFNEKSIIARINRNEDVAPNDMFLDVFRLAQQVSGDTDGAFDITVAPLVNAWGFGFKSGDMPTPQQVDSIRCFVGYQKVTLTDGQGHPAGQHAKGQALRIAKSDPRVMLDCSAIAKGYGADVVASLLSAKGVKNYCVEIGGEIVTSGISPKRVPWKIGVTKPSEPDQADSGHLQAVLNVTDRAMATSGNYRNFYYKGGRRYAHTIDPKTGRPVQHNILSATVLASQCARADAYATAFMVMGLDGAQAVLERNPDLMAYLIYDNEGRNEIWYSPSLRDKIQE